MSSILFKIIILWYNLNIYNNEGGEIMKEAAGEANLTVITIIILGVVAAIMTPIITGILNSNADRGKCTSAGYIYEGNTCKDPRTGAVIPPGSY